MKLRIVVLGMMGACPYGGQTWLYLNWLSGLRSLGHDVWYVEDNRMWQYDPTSQTFTDDCRYAVGHVARALEGIGLGGRWMYRWDATDTCWGGSARQLGQLYRSCDVLLNICAATELHGDQLLAPFRVRVETDPVVDELKLAIGDERLRRQMDLHHAFATYGERYGQPDCPVPLSGFHFVRTRQPVDLDQWPLAYDPDARWFTTIGNFRTGTGFDHDLAGYDTEYEGEVYTWSKHHEWMRFIDLPALTRQPLQLALSADEADAGLMRDHGWDVVPTVPMSLDVFGSYRRYIQWSRGEFTVAKDQNIRLRSGWFSERDACYLASGKPVVTQDTAAVLPAGEGLFYVRTPDEAADAIERINSDYGRHCRAARHLAEEYLEAEAVAGRLLADLGM
jgi:hypothetical protein